MFSCLPNCVYSAILSHKEWTSFWGGRSQSRELTVRKDVHNALDNLNASWLTHIASLYQLDSAQKNHDGVKVLYKHNQVTSTTVTDAILKLGQAKIAVLQSEVNYQLAMVQLATATGTLMGHSQVEWKAPE